MYNLEYSKKFKKDLKKLIKNNFSLKELEYILDLLISNKLLDKKYLNHRLRGEFKRCFECHIKPDVLLIYEIDNKKMVIYLLRIGSHPELFG